jgi:toxin-antitoxin system PIN domain toxin
MRLIDANLLLYAANSDAPLHREAKRWLEDTLAGGQTVAFSWSVILAFLRLTTRPGLFRRPLPVEVAFEVVADRLAQPAATVILPGPRHLAMLRELLQPLGAAGNLTADAHLAALALEHGAELCSCDGDFARFPGLRWINPLA